MKNYIRKTLKNGLSLDKKKVFLDAPKILKKDLLSPEQLLSLLLSKDEKGFNYLYENYAGALYGIIFRIVQNICASKNTAALRNFHGGC